MTADDHLVTLLRFRTPEKIRFHLRSRFSGIRGSILSSSHLSQHRLRPVSALADGRSLVTTVQARTRTSEDFSWYRLTLIQQPAGLVLTFSQVQRSCLPSYPEPALGGSTVRTPPDGVGAYLCTGSF